MLERVSSSAECAAQIFLRRLEAPVRSQRSLGLAFWRHGGDCIEVPAWWPMYLEDIRSRSHASLGNLKVDTTTSTRTVIPRYKASTSTRAKNRTFSNAAPYRQTTTVQVAVEEDIEHREIKEQRPIDVTVDTVRATKEEWHEWSRDKRKRRGRTSQTGEDKLVKIWKDFVTSGFNALQASQSLHILAGGIKERDLNRAIQMFNIIPKHERSAQDYEVAVNVSIRLNRYSFTIQAIKEAVSRNLSQEIFFKFLALCISKSLWITAATLWQAVGRLQAFNLRAASKDPATNKRNIAGRYISCFDTIPDLPSKLVSLAARLQSGDSALRESKDDLIDLCKSLALVVVESPRIMGIITEKGICAVFAIQRQFGFNSELHFAALATIDQMRDKGTRCKLATLIYNNFKSMYPNASMPKWVLGTMLGIYTDGKQPPLVYRTVLKDYKRMYGTPEDTIYHRVMKACAKLGESDHVQAVFDEFCKDSKPKNADFLNPLIHVHAVIGDCQKAQFRFDHISATFGFKQSPKNWNTLLLAYSRSNQSHITYKKFREMQQSNISPDQYSWSILVSAAAREGDTKYARDLVRQAQAAGVSTPFAMTGAVVDSYLLNDRSDDAFALVVQASQSPEAANETPIRLWNSLFRYYAFKSDSDAILRTQKKMKELDIQADSMTYAALMTALVVQGRTRDATQVLRTLHFSQSLSANEFHYSILIYGFAMEKKPDFASIIYHEMLERFGRATPSARLSMLHLQANQAEEKAKLAYLSGEPHLKPDFEPVLNTLEDIFENTQPADLASLYPNPGFGRRTPRNNLKDVYFGSLIKFLHRNHAHSSAKQIIGMLETREPLSASHDTSSTPSWQSTVDRLSYQLEGSVASRDWAVVEKKWKDLVDIALQNCVSVEARGYSFTQQPFNSNRSHNIEAVDDGEFQFSSMIPAPFTADGLPGASARVLSCYRFVISRALSQYVKALGEQQKYLEMVQTVQKLRQCGFSLSSKNWNGLIQALCKSSDFDYRVLAFELFEMYLLPNAPSWNVIRRGMWVTPSEERPRNKWDAILRRKDARKPRKLLEQLNPSLLMPTYYTMVHLASVWLKASRLAFEGDRTERQRLERQASGTVKLVLQTPYLRDRVQGVLLRGTRVIGDPVKRPRQSQSTANFGGVQGSQLLVDRITADLLNEVKATTDAENEPDQEHQLLLAEKILGKTDKSRVFIPSKGRIESLDEQSQRIDQAQNRNLAIIQRLAQQIRQDTQNPPQLVGTIARGVTPRNSSELPTTKEHVLTRQSDQRRFAFPSGVRRVLRRVKRSMLYPPTALKANRQRTAIRTSSLTRRQGLVLDAPSSEQGYPVALARRKPLRQRKLSDAKVAARKSHSRIRAHKSSIKSNATIQEETRAPQTNPAIEAYLQHRLRSLQRTYWKKRIQILGRITPSQKRIKQLTWYRFSVKRARKNLLKYRKKVPDA